MQNAGLPEAGDAVMTFPAEIVADPDRYAAAASLPVDGSITELEEAVGRRRDLAVEGFGRLLASARDDDFAPLYGFYDAAVALVRPRVAGWRETWRRTVEREVRHTGHVLDALEHGDGKHLGHSTLLQSTATEPARWGMCGRLGTHEVAGE
jgi:hypothetical protein